MVKKSEINHSTFEKLNSKVRSNFFFIKVIKVL